MYNTSTEPKVLLAGCSFTDPLWQSVKPWSLHYGSKFDSYIVAQAAMGIKGICTETLSYLRDLKSVEKIIIILPTLWRMDIEVDHETHFVNCMVNLLTVHGDHLDIHQQTKRKWIISGGLNFSDHTRFNDIFKPLYRYQGFLVILKEHFRALEMLQWYCRQHGIKLYISAIQDPLQQLHGLDYIKHDIHHELDRVAYQQWFRFQGKFIDEFLGHNRHPDDEEHKLLNEIIQSETR